MFLNRKKIRKLVLKEFASVINEQESGIPDGFYGLNPIEQVLHMLNEGLVMPFAFERRGYKIIMTSRDREMTGTEDKLEITVRDISPR